MHEFEKTPRIEIFRFFYYHISPSLNINKENTKTPAFKKILETNHWPL